MLVMCYKLGKILGRILTFRYFSYFFVIIEEKMEVLSFFHILHFKASQITSVCVYHHFLHIKTAFSQVDEFHQSRLLWKVLADG